MSRPRLLIISFSNIAADARVLKQVDHFAPKYEVTTLGYGPTPHPHVTHLQLSDELQIRRWKRRDLILRRFEWIYWHQPVIIQALSELRAKEPFDVIMANDVDAVPLALELKPRAGVHADIHEYAPRQNEEILVWRVFIAPFVKWMCRTSLPRASSVTTVGGGLADEYLRVFGVNAGVVTNATPYAALRPTAVGEPIRLVHSGASLRNRRLEVLIDAVEATRSDVTLDLFLMGNQPEYVDELRERIAASERVRILEPVPYRDLIERLNSYDIGVHVIAPTNFNNRWSLPNKFFDYVQARLGLIIGPSAEMSRILEQYGFGAIAEDFSAAALTRVLDSLSTESVASWKSRADEAARALSAEVQVEKWDRAVREILERAT